MPRLTQSALSALPRRVRRNPKRSDGTRLLTVSEAEAMRLSASRVTAWEPPRAPEWLRELGKNLERS